MIRFIKKAFRDISSGRNLEYYITLLFILVILALDIFNTLSPSAEARAVIADSQNTRILTISVDSFDDLLDRDPDFARRVLELESRQLQQFVRSLQT